VRHCTDRTTSQDSGQEFERSWLFQLALFARLTVIASFSNKDAENAVSEGPNRQRAASDIKDMILDAEFLESILMLVCHRRKPGFVVVRLQCVLYLLQRA
jgi:hypothetical protein